MWDMAAQVYPAFTAWVPRMYFKDDVPSVLHIATYSKDHWDQLLGKWLSLKQYLL